MSEFKDNEEEQNPEDRDIAISDMERKLRVTKETEDVQTNNQNK